MTKQWMLYGAYGYTGRLITAEAVARGHRPLLAGRDPERLAALAAEFDLPHLRLSLTDTAALQRAVADVDAVLHSAGPFIRTAKPMRDACLNGGTHYLDITGEIPVFEASLQADAAARAAGIAIISGVGFDIVPTDCLGAYVAAQLADAVRLDVAIAGFEAASGGTMITALEQIELGAQVRRDGQLVSIPMGSGARMIPFNDATTRRAIPAPLGDVVTGERSTGIPTVAVYVAFPFSRLISATAPLTTPLMRIGPLKRGLQSLINRFVDGPSAKTRAETRTRFWARATNAVGDYREAWLEMPETYVTTALASVRAVERVLAGDMVEPAGGLTPSLAFGADFILDIPNTTRFDTLP